MEQPTGPVRARPHTGAHFLVDLGVGNSWNPEKGFCEVVFPEFRVDKPERAGAADSACVGSPSENENTGRRLILRRGVTGSLDLYMWWNEARRDKTLEGRTIKVQLMTADLSSVVLTWYFHGARPVCLSYTPLNALQATVFIESIELEFDTMEMR
jgi:phage tail-like protein